MNYLIAATADGVFFQTAPRRHKQAYVDRVDVDLVRVVYLDPSRISRVVAAIENATFEFAASAYPELRYGDLLTDFWQQYRREVEVALHRMDLDQHLATIEQGLNSDNETGWRAGVLACRSLLEDLAAHLWRDARPTYDALPGDGPGEHLSVTADKYVNRISAYLHQREVTGQGGRFIRDEADRLSSSLRALVGYQSTAHSPITKLDARSIALGTYFLIGELTSKTDLEPVEEY